MGMMRPSGQVEAAVMLYPIASLQRVTSAIFEAAGSCKAEADLVADHLLEAHLSGHDSHGLIRVLAYVRGIEMGRRFAKAFHCNVFDMLFDPER